MPGRQRILELGLVFLAGCVVLGGRLVQLQVIDHRFWEDEAIKSRTRSRVLPFRRGSILDRNQTPLASSEYVYDLELYFAEFRKRTAAGQLLLTHYLLTGERAPVTHVLEQPDAYLDALCRLTTGELRRLEPRQRRLDLCTYAAWLAGESNSAGLRAHVARATDTAPFAPALSEARVEVLVNVAQERQVLHGLEHELGLIPGDIARAMEEQIQWIDDRVVVALERQEDRRGRLFEAEREMHAEYDYRVRTLFREVPHAAVFDLLVDPDLFPGLRVQSRTRRFYPPTADVCPLLLGWVGNASDTDLETIEAHRERLEDLSLALSLTREEREEAERLRVQIREMDVRAEEEVGRLGLERVYESVLRGRRGFQKVESDRRGDTNRVLEEVPPRDGDDLVLTLDLVWQQVAEELLQGQPFAGAVVLIELPERKIRVLASHPEPTREYLSREGLKDDPRWHWLHPRAYGPYYPPPPGSSVKPLFAVQGLTEGIFRPETHYLCNMNAVGPPGHPVRCLGLHEQVEVRRALIKSCNHFFAHLAERAGYQRLYRWAEAFGFGRATEFATGRLADGRQFDGLFPPEAGCPLDQDERGLRNLMLFGFGQGAIDDVTPLQVAGAMGALGTGRWLPPTVIERIGQEVPLRPDPVPLNLSAQAHDVVLDAMREVTRAGGTAGPGRLPGLDLSSYDLATKTGTSQVQGREDHSWLAGFFPSARPRFAFAVFLEHTGVHGGDVCAPILQAMLEHPACAGLCAAAQGEP